MNKRPLFSFWLLLTVAFVIFFCYSLIDPIDIFGYHPRQSKLSDKLFADLPGKVVSVSDSVSQDSIVKEAVKLLPDTTPQTILFIGDSMLDGLSPRLAAYCQASADTLYSVVWYSSTSEAWGKIKRLEEYIARTKPTFIFISLGSNELMVKDIKEKREKFVREIIRQTSGIPFVWIGPPNWKEDTGINDLIRDNVPAGCYFRSAEMKFNRRKDGAHPTAESASLWMDSIIRWLPEHHPHPLAFKIPQSRTARPKRIFVHSPQEI